MLKYLLVSLFIAILPASMLMAKDQPVDSLVHIAQSDAHKFRLNDADMKKFRKDRHNSTSDYFKPVKTSVSDTTLLQDSAYVKAYRAAAYNKTRKRRTVWHDVWVGTAVLYGASLVVIMAIVFSPGYKGR
ncbi:hypothetical protein HDF18_17170 [Mucilaginibacter sp. X5P1]|uniref:hypothetical protein n=1 Tax=Mucilaginibacter sp. X5P1 TaxID=2723088 RepID=UPI00160EB2F3|nr:hypothetical protein [Mucilaginibacter sp. X5P1]MBB6139367.1 hypothetical protein [Mucilaginibacter sp. X5P1]